MPPTTDGDESPDATEVDNGTNPLDVESYANG
jgi:hypothetical protein